MSHAYSAPLLGDRGSDTTVGCIQAPDLGEAKTPASPTTRADWEDIKSFISKYDRSYADLTKQADELGIDLTSGRRKGLVTCRRLCAGTRAHYFAWSVLILLFFFVGALVYSKLNGWTYSCSLYYASQVAWCVGFGAIEEDSDDSKWWTVIFNLTGASIIGVAIVYFLQMTLENQEAWKEEEVVLTMNRSAIADLRRHDKKLKGRRDSEATLTRCRPGTRTREESERKDKAEGQGEGTAGEEPDDSVDAAAASAFFLLLLGGTQRAALKAYAVFPILLTVAWISIGVTYGMWFERWNFVTSLYFAVTALTTAGLQAASIDPDKDTLANWFTAFYVMLGVPIFASTIGWIASKFFEQHTRAQVREKVRRRLAKEDLEFASLLLANMKDDKKGGGKQVTYGEFLEFMLVRLSLADVGMLGTLRQRFEELDKRRTGHITLDDIQAELEFERFDMNKDGVIKMVEFVTICGKLGIGADNLERLDIFNRIDLAGKGEMDRRAFSTWWHSEGSFMLPQSNTDRTVAIIAGGLENARQRGPSSLLERAATSLPDGKRLSSGRDLSRSRSGSRPGSSSLLRRGGLQRAVSTPLQPHPE